MKKFITTGIVSAILLISPFSAQAFSTSDMAVINLLAQEIQLMEQQINSIIDQLHVLASSVPTSTPAPVVVPATQPVPATSTPGQFTNNPAYAPMPNAPTYMSDQSVQPSTVTINLSVSPTTVAQGGSVSIVWSASPTNVQCSRSWLPSVGYQGTFAGTEGYGNLQPPSVTFSVNCKNTINGATGSASKTVTVTSSQTSNVLDSISQALEQIRQQIPNIR